MKDRHPPRSALIAIIVVLLIVGYYGFRALATGSDGQLKASGTIEAVSVEISPELSGKVRQVLVDEGQTVRVGDPLMTLDDALLKEQRKAAVAGLESAKAASITARSTMEIAHAQYEQTLETALAQAKGTRLQDWFAKDQLQFDQPNWYFSRVEQIQAVQGQIDEARKSWDQAESRLSILTANLKNADFFAAEQRVLNARMAYLITKVVNERGQNSTDVDAPNGRYNRTHCGTNQGYRLANRHLINVIYGCTGDEHLSYASEKLFDDAQAELDVAQQTYDLLLTTQAADDILAARAEVAVAQEWYYAALDRLRSFQTGDQSYGVRAAQGSVEQAQAVYDQTLTAVTQSQANLDLIDAQLAKLTVYSPIDGVILTRSVEPGEFVQPGAVALVVGDLSQLTITVYVPEDRYGQVHLSQNANVRVDSFPRLALIAEVIHIADAAEFTPRNVQTAEGRSSTVYAIKLTVTDPEGKLKPGMPADVVFDT